ncbi:hypothetical protein CSKR_202350 [Clonorchis sinensis]|uniref:Uncharacterized protein n=1 Tax=Clonorchis sinensis TaxID=79923 RepID=A0A8T1MVP9_CLOSI|nr:hypothetical protein CSKR_202350 [Clonorchis sinensis]
MEAHSYNHPCSPSAVVIMFGASCTRIHIGLTLASLQGIYIVRHVFLCTRSSQPFFVLLSSGYIPDDCSCDLSMMNLRNFAHTPITCAAVAAHSLPYLLLCCLPSFL